MPEIQKFITDKYINKKFSPEGYVFDFNIK